MIGEKQIMDYTQILNSIDKNLLLIIILLLINNSLVLGLLIPKIIKAFKKADK